MGDSISGRSSSFLRKRRPQQELDRVLVEGVLALTEDREIAIAEQFEAMENDSFVARQMDEQWYWDNLPLTSLLEEESDLCRKMDQADMDADYDPLDLERDFQDIERQHRQASGSDEGSCYAEDIWEPLPDGSVHYNNPLEQRLFLKHQ